MKRAWLWRKRRDDGGEDRLDVRDYVFWRHA